MKKLALLILLASASSAFADDNLLKNGDFSDGISHWEGDCHTIDASTFDPSMANPPTSGVVIKLRNGDWTKVTQDFETKPGKLNLSIIYIFSPGLTFSTKPEDYTNTTGAVGYTAWMAFPTEVGKWVVMLCDGAAGRASIFSVNAHNTETGPQTFEASFLGKSDEGKSLCLAFPPGDGYITLQKVALTSGTGADAAP